MNSQIIKQLMLETQEKIINEILSSDLPNFLKKILIVKAVHNFLYVAIKLGFPYSKLPKLYPTVRLRGINDRTTRTALKFFELSNRINQAWVDFALRAAEEERKCSCRQ